MIRFRFAFVAAAAALLPLALSAPAQASAVAAPSASTVQATSQVVPDGSPSTCPSGWFCFYQDSNFNGRRVQFQDCGLQNLTNFGFNDEASSWVNHTSSSITVFRDINGGGGILWTEGPNSSSSFVGSANNDKASSFRRNC